MPPTATDAELIHQARAGDQHAFGVLLRRHDRSQRSLAHRMLGDAVAMDDALQEAYLKAWRSLDGFRGDASFSTWLHRITYRCCIDAIRSRRLVDPLDDEFVVDATGASDAVGDRLDVRRALRRLPEDQRACVVLVDLEGHDYQSVARILDVAEGTVASRLHRGRAALRAALADHREDLR